MSDIDRSYKIKKKDLSTYEQQNKLQFEERGQGGAGPRGQALFEFGIIILAAVWFHCTANAMKYELLSLSLSL